MGWFCERLYPIRSQKVRNYPIRTQEIKNKILFLTGGNPYCRPLFVAVKFTNPLAFVVPALQTGSQVLHVQDSLRKLMGFGASKCSAIIVERPSAHAHYSNNNIYHYYYLQCSCLILV